MARKMKPKKSQSQKRKPDLRNASKRNRKMQQVNADCGSRLFIQSLTTDELNLVGYAKSGAELLKKDFPSVTFTSGRRTIDEQADAMAGNVVKQRDWIAKTYLATIQSKQLQQWVDDNPGATTKAAIKTGLLSIMNAWSEDDMFNITRHIAGLAFDVYPVADPDGVKVKAAIKKLDKLNKFLEKEGGLVIWHAQFDKK